MAKVSIIVPTYNVEQYIRKCLDSLVNQTSKDFVAYIINDGSPANEYAIANEYAEKYDFIKSIKKENGGYGSVLNYAFEMIDTPYALICDPDDYLVDHAIEHLLNLMENSHADMVVASKNLIYSDNSEVVYDCSYNNKMVTLKDKKVYTRDANDFSDLYFLDPSPHSKLYKTELAKKVKFPLKVSFTDNLLFFICLNQAQSVVYSNEAIAYYLINREGNTSTDVKPQVIDYWLKVQTEILNQSKEINNIPDIFYYRMFETFKFVFNMIDRVHADKTVLKEKLSSIDGTPPDLIAPPKGCPFAPRCDYAMKICYDKKPDIFESENNHKTACWLCNSEAPKVENPIIKMREEEFVNG